LLVVFACYVREFPVLGGFAIGSSDEVVPGLFCSPVISANDNAAFPSPIRASQHLLSDFDPIHKLHSAP